jgi:hypothetical protein
VTARPNERQFVTHIAALPGNPYDGHTLATKTGGELAPDIQGRTQTLVWKDATAFGFEGTTVLHDMSFGIERCQL